MPGKPYIPFYIGDWKKDPGVQLLTLEEKGAWVELIFWIHERGENGGLSIRNMPLTMIHISKILNCDVEKAEEISSKLIATDVVGFDEGTGVIYCKRLRREAEIREIRAESGRMGGLAKALASKEQKSSKGPSKSLAPADNDNDNDIDSSKGKGGEEYSQEFEIVWGLYPDRQGSNPKKAAWKSWKARLKEGIPTVHLIQAVKAYNQECNESGKAGSEFVMQARTFFGPNEQWKEYVHKSEKEIERQCKVIEDNQPLREVSVEERAAQLKEIDKIVGDLAGRMKAE